MQYFLEFNKHLKFKLHTTCINHRKSSNVTWNAKGIMTVKETTYVIMGNALNLIKNSTEKTLHSMCKHNGKVQDSNVCQTRNALWICYAFRTFAGHPVPLTYCVQ